MDISLSIQEKFQKEELVSECFINKLRIILLTVILLAMTVSILLFKSVYEKRYIYFSIITVIYLIISILFQIKFRKKRYISYAKYLFVFLDIFLITIVIFLTRYTATGKVFACTIDIAEVYLIFLVNILSGLRFNIKLTIYTAILSLLSISSMAAHDYIHNVFTSPDIEIKYIFTAIYSVAITLASGYIGIRAKKIIIDNLIEQDERKMAKEIQTNLIPKFDPSLPNILINSMYKPMNEVGGDFYDYITFQNKNLLGIFIGDVSGHGFPAALITSMVKSIINISYENKMHPEKLLKFLNANLYGHTNNNFLTAFYGILDRKEKLFRFARAGHPYPLLIRGNEIIELSSKGKLLGMFKEVEIESKTIKLYKGDKIVFYTDGLIEARNKKFIEFGHTNIMERILIDNAYKNPKEIIDALYKSLVNFRGSEEFNDDICIIVLSL